jgi:hypothetical protein
VWVHVDEKVNDNARREERGKDCPGKGNLKLDTEWRSELVFGREEAGGEKRRVKRTKTKGAERCFVDGSSNFFSLVWHDRGYKSESRRKTRRNRFREYF